MLVKMLLCPGMSSLRTPPFLLIAIDRIYSINSRASSFISVPLTSRVLTSIYHFCLICHYLLACNHSIRQTANRKCSIINANHSLIFRFSLLTIMTNKRANYWRTPFTHGKTLRTFHLFLSFENFPC